MMEDEGGGGGEGGVARRQAVEEGNLALLGVGLLDHAQIRVGPETYFAHNGEVSPALEPIGRCGGLHHARSRDLVSRPSVGFPADDSGRFGPLAKGASTSRTAPLPPSSLMRRCCERTRLARDPARQTSSGSRGLAKVYILVTLQSHCWQPGNFCLQSQVATQQKTRGATRKIASSQDTGSEPQSTRQQTCNQDTEHRGCTWFNTQMFAGQNS